MEKLCIKPSACFLAAAAILILPIPWFFSAIAAATFHELCHWISLRLMGKKIRSLTISCRGAILETEPLTTNQELICALAGPLGSLSMLGLLQFFPGMVLCATIHGMYNLLPLYPLDGGRAIHCACKRFLSPNAAKKFCNTVEILVGALILLAGISTALVFRLGFFPVLFSLIIAGRCLLRKIPCKAAKLGVQ